MEFLTAPGWFGVMKLRRYFELQSRGFWIFDCRCNLCNSTCPCVWKTAHETQRSVGKAAIRSLLVREDT
jgi:hypothetical protein